MTDILKTIADLLKSISDGIAGLSGTALTFAGALAIAGTLSMAILQVIKELTPVRGIYQRRWLERRFKERAERFGVDAGHARANDAIKPYLPIDGARAQSLLVELATGGEANAFYDLAIEQMVAQMNAAAQIALEYPRLYFQLLAVLSQGAAMEDVARVVLADAAAGGEGKPTPLDARNRVGHRIQRNLDGIQIALGSRWRLWMQLVAISLTILFVEVAILTNVKGYSVATLLMGIILGIVGGYLAPVTRDVVAALQSLRKS
jgi:hypothetical protein